MNKLLCKLIRHKLKTKEEGRYFIYCQRCGQDCTIESMNLSAKHMMNNKTFGINEYKNQLKQQMFKYRRQKDGEIYITWEDIKKILK